MKKVLAVALMAASLPLAAATTVKEWSMDQTAEQHAANMVKNGWKKYSSTIYLKGRQEVVLNFRANSIDFNCHVFNVCNMDIDSVAQMVVNGNVSSTSMRYNSYRLEPGMYQKQWCGVTSGGASVCVYTVGAPGAAPLFGPHIIFTGVEGQAGFK